MLANGGATDLQFFQRDVQRQYIHHRRANERLLDMRIQHLLKGRHRQIARGRNTRQLIGNRGRWRPFNN